MIKKSTILLLFGSVFLIVGLSYGNKQQEYPSPDGKYIAYVIALPKARYGSGESEIIIKTKKGKILCSKNYGSESGEHGLGVERAAWTPDSQFFIYSMSSSGGHQAWHFPTDFIAVRDFKIRSLDNYLGLITDPDFDLMAPDIIRITGRRIGDLLRERNFETNLNKLIEKDK